jgi:S-adenosylmethionine:tRNA ribosyltransferase-isomerase
LLVINNTKVIPARLFGYREGGETKFEALLLRRMNYTDWECIMRPAKKARIGTEFTFSSELKATVIAFGEDGIRILSFKFDGIFEDVLSRVGNVPLPPYIKEKLEDESRYQTVYSKVDGSSAAPTAGLHFTNELMDKLKGEGIEFCEVLCILVYQPLDQ